MQVGSELSCRFSPDGFSLQRLASSPDQILATVAAIRDPFEQSFFLMVQLPYLQPFDDVNKRLSRLAANIPLIKSNLSPLSFTDVPRSIYTEAILGVYELNKIDLLKDVFIWAYERSAARYAAVRQSLGEPDPFRLQHRNALREIVGEIVRQRLGRKAACAHIASWVENNVEPAVRERFREIAESELLNLHEGNYARYQITPTVFATWQQVWTETTTQVEGLMPPKKKLGQRKRPLPELFKAWRQRVLHPEFPLPIFAAVLRAICLIKRQMATNFHF